MSFGFVHVWINLMMTSIACLISPMYTMHLQHVMCTIYQTPWRLAVPTASLERSHFQPWALSSPRLETPFQGFVLSDGFEFVERQSKVLARVQSLDIRKFNDNMGGIGSSQILSFVHSPVWRTLAGLSCAMCPQSSMEKHSIRSKQA